MKRPFATRSIAFRLILAVLSVEALSAVLVILLSYGYERHAHFVSFGVMLRGRADSVLGAVQDSEDPQDDLMLTESDLHLPHGDIWQAMDQDGRVLGRSPNWNGSIAGAKSKGHDGLMRMDVNHHHYALLVLRGTRLIDPDSKGGGILHQVTVYYGSPTEHVWEAIWRAVDFYAAGSLLLLGVTGPLMAWLLHRGLLPLRELAVQAGSISANAWHFSPPEAARVTPELAPLTLALESAMERLEKAFKQQRVFVSDAAHELKTAVAVTKSSLQLLNLKPRSRDEYEVGLERCLQDTERMEALVAQMLTLARVESADTATTQNMSCSLRQCVQEATRHLETVARLRGIEMHLEEKDGDEAEVALSSDDCLILASNLLLNAIQHGAPGSIVHVSVTCEESAVRFTVQDEGEGIDPASVDHLFDRFYRGDASRDRATGGAGLGLAICKGIVENARGQISIENAAPHGAIASVLFPRISS